MKKLLVLVLVLFQQLTAFGLDTLTVYETSSKFITNKNFVQLEDPEGKFDIKKVINSSQFHSTLRTLPSIGYNNKIIWLKIVIKNKSTQPFIPITINSSIIDDFDLYFVSNNRQIIHLASHFPRFSLKKIEPNLTHINCSILPDSTRTIYLRIKSNVNSIIPIQVYSANNFLQSIGSQNLIIGAFIGVIIIMAVYNLLLFIIVKDISYLYYVSYIIFLGITQALLKGYGTNLLSSDKQTINTILIPLFRVIFGYSILLFVFEFLQIRQTGKNLKLYFGFLFIVYTLPLVAIIFGYTPVAYNLITISALTVSFSLLAIGTWLYFKGYEPAKYFMLGWTFFLSSVILSVARNQGVLEYNNFTVNIILYGSAIEIVLFSAALADKINFYKHQNAESQTAALTIALENEKLITEQNIVLEKKVNERTAELIESNKTLSVSIENLKAAQMQLVETEKMASLGQLTAGIAHEINNPINFVSSNIKPLRMDFVEVFNLIDKYVAMEKNLSNSDFAEEAIRYRKEIDVAFIKSEILTLLEGIEEGAIRTKEIVNSLRTFSRTDEQGLKPTEINKTILSTVVILRSTIPSYIKITPVLDKLPLINCYPGQIGQILINLLSNSIHAIKSKSEHSNEGIWITTNDFEDYIAIEITDTGTGITPEVKQRMFDPFFTTKDVGEGTGLGLSIVFGIIEKHKGQIKVESEYGKGTTFTIHIPKNLS